eukprot:g7197.t1
MQNHISTVGHTTCGYINANGLTLCRTGTTSRSKLPPTGQFVSSRSSSLSLKPTTKASSKFGLCGRNEILTTITELLATPVSEPPTTETESEEDPPQISPAAAKQLSKANRVLRSYGWFGFWTQLALGITSGVVLLFSIAYTVQTAPRVSLYLTALGVAATFIACFQYFGMVRTGRRIKDYLEAEPESKIKKVSKEAVLNSISQTLTTAVLGLGMTIVAMQSSVGLLLAKTLSNASANPFIAGAQGNWNPVLAFDVFMLQASTNTILSHTIGAMICLWLLIKIRDRSLWEALFGPPKPKA